MKRILMAAMSLLSCYAIADTEVVDGITWTYTISDGEASVGGGWQSYAVPSSTTGNITIPSTLGGCPVTSIGSYAFEVSGLTSVTIPNSVTSIKSSAFHNCSGLTSITIPSSVTSIGDDAFAGCSALSEIIFEGNAPVTGSNIFSRTPTDMVIRVNEDSDGWTSPWSGKTLVKKSNETTDVKSSGTTGVSLTVTNVVIQYIVNSVMPEKVYPATSDTGFVNIITEVKSGGAVSVPATWMVNYPNYVAKFGSDFTKSLMKTTGKKDGANNPMCVWQDYVAGTDPTDTNDVFTASITTDANGKIIISYNPELSDDEKAKRIYKTFGKVKLTDADWIEVPSGHEADYNFFKVTVEMK